MTSNLSIQQGKTEALISSEQFAEKVREYDKESLMILSRGLDMTKPPSKDGWLHDYKVNNTPNPMLKALS